MYCASFIISYTILINFLMAALHQVLFCLFNMFQKIEAMAERQANYISYRPTQLCTIN